MHVASKKHGIKINLICGIGIVKSADKLSRFCCLSRGLGTIQKIHRSVESLKMHFEIVDDQKTHG